MSLWVLCLYSQLIPEMLAVLPFPLLDLNFPLNDEVECRDYSTDCVDKKGLCKNEAFKQIMYTKCAKTCQICGEIVKDDDPLYNVNIQGPTHTDYETNWKHPRMDTDKSYSTEVYGHSEEIRSESFEEPNINHLILRPPSAPPTKFRMRKTPVSRVCLDVAPNCFYLKSLCFNKFYLPVMQNNCRRTCGFCGPTPSPTPTRQPSYNHRWRPSARPQPPTYESDLCTNRGLDCDEKLHLCTHWRYWKLMRRICALSCGFCDPEDFYTN